jgi:hypothetical protein
MKKLIAIAILSGFTFGFAADGMCYDNVNNEEVPKVTNNPIEPDNLKDCTVRLDFKLADGTIIQGEITFEDVTWWQCTKMQLAAWWERNF